MKRDKRKKEFVICIKNNSYQTSLEKRKIYPSVPDKEAEKRHLIRIVDESGESYLFPMEYFVPIKLPQEIAKAVAQAA